MSLEKILKKIEQAAQSEVQNILEKNMAEMKTLEEKKGQEINDLEKEIEREQSAIEIEVKNGFLLPARLRVRGAKLHKKNELLKRAFSEALSFKGEELAKVFEYLVPKENLEKAMVVPSKVQEKEIKSFFEKKKIKVEMAGADEKLEGGFIVKTGKIEYDCTFKTLLKNLEEKLKPQLADLF